MKTKNTMFGPKVHGSKNVKERKPLNKVKIRMNILKRLIHA